VDGSEYARTILPRLRAEFQPTRAFFLRGIAEYRAERRSACAPRVPDTPSPSTACRPPAWTPTPCASSCSHPTGPTPGTVAFLGYGASLNEPDSFGFRDLSRTSDGLFVKLAYQIRR
jgi:hypothetical protein